MDYAGFWSRVGATLIDGIVLLVVMLVVAGATGTHLIPDLSKMAGPAVAPGGSSAPGMPGMPGGPGAPGGPNTPGFPRMSPGAGNVGSSPEITSYIEGLSSLRRIMTLIGFLYTVCLTGFCGATLGKMALGLKVVRTDGDPIGIGRAILRYVVEEVVAGVTFGLAFIAVAVTEKKQGLHDMVAGSVVIRVR